MDLINIIFGIATIIGTLFGIISAIDARRSKKELNEFSYLFSIAEKNIDKDLTQDELNRLHQEKKDMKKALDDLEKTIKNDVPKQARKTVLYDRLKADEEYLSISYNRYTETKNEYEKLEKETNIQIPQKIMDEIELQILPDYLIKQKKQKYLSMLTMISYVTAFLSALPTINVFSKYLILITIYPLIRLIMLNMPKDKCERRKYILNLLLIVAIIVLTMINIYLGFNIYFHWHNVYESEMIITITLPLLVLLIISKIVITLIKYFKKRKK